MYGLVEACPGCHFLLGLESDKASSEQLCCCRAVRASGDSTWSARFVFVTKRLSGDFFCYKAACPLIQGGWSVFCYKRLSGGLFCYQVAYPGLGGFSVTRRLVLVQRDCHFGGG